MGARTSADIREHDRSVLLEEEERDRLLEESRRRGRGGSALLVAPLKKLFSKNTTDLSLGLGNGSGDLLNEEKGAGKRAGEKEEEKGEEGGEEGEVDE